VRVLRQRPQRHGPQLTAGEILEQLLRLRNLLPADERLTHVVVMGMGERWLTWTRCCRPWTPPPAGQPRHRRPPRHHLDRGLAGEDPPPRRLGKKYHLAVSLHAPTSAAHADRATTTKPAWGRSWRLRLLLRAHRRQVTYEYVLLGDVNDGPEQSQELAGCCAAAAPRQPDSLQRRGGPALCRPTDDALGAFVSGLRRAGISVKVRKRKGSASTRPVGSCGVGLRKTQRRRRRRICCRRPGLNNSTGQGK